MIFVKRSESPSSLDLTDPASAASKELAQCVDYWDLHKSAPPSSNFKAYARDDVRAALTELFKGKCAYCESPVSGSSQTDIEHYRPKGGVTEAEKAGIDHPGYWWLAMQWPNLVLSCMHCNQERRQLIFSSGMTEAEIRTAIEGNDLQTTGKKNAFPTVDDIWVVDHSASLAGEHPLLIDPTDTDPEPLIEWVLEGALSTMRARNGDGRADSTIKVLGLNRRYLTEARAQTLNTLRLLGQNVRRRLVAFQNAKTDEGARIALEAADDDLEAIAALGLPEKPHAGLARAYLADVQAMVAQMI